MDDIANKVTEILKDSMYREEEVPDRTNIPVDAVIVDGITSKFGMHPQRLESHRQEVIEILQEMNPVFFESTGSGGYSFLALPCDKNGEQWGEHSNCEQLIVLAMGLKLARYCLSRDKWNLLPGNMPYVVFTIEGM